MAKPQPHHASEDTHAKASVFVQTGQPIETRSFPLPGSLAPGAALCKVELSTICGSDLHTIEGRRQEPAPLILGHEIVGRVAALGRGLEEDWLGNPLKVGDRITWSIVVACGDCFYCHKQLPQKCEDLIKYGHCCCEGEHPLTGGFSEYIYLHPRTCIIKLPDSVSSQAAAPANCVLATACNALDSVGCVRGESVLIQGAGLLGVYLSALCKEAGAERIFVTDMQPARLEMATRFGADVGIDLSHISPEGAEALVKAETFGRGVDVVFEACGVSTVVPHGLDLLCKGGRYLVAGLVSPNSPINIPGEVLTRNCLSLIGIHNYRPEHLASAIRFLEEAGDRYPLDEIVGATYALSRFEDAVEDAKSQKHLRVAVRPGPGAARGGAAAENRLRVVIPDGVAPVSLPPRKTASSEPNT
ncbi:zinc-binding dehydrogenase [Phycisphaeraceae bacterium D3-23]